MEGAGAGAVSGTASTWVGSFRLSHNPRINVSVLFSTTAAPLTTPGHLLGCLPSLHSHGEMLRGSRNNDVLSQFTRIQV